MNKTFILILFSVSAYCQTYQFGKVSKDLLELPECPIDKDAYAMITYKSGERDVDYVQGDGFNTSMKFKKQYKIFNSDAKDIGTVSFFYYSPKTSSYKINLYELKGRTYNLENDKIVETKISDENIQKVQYNNYYKKVSITMPAIQKGCVFEFEYNLTSNALSNIEDYDIQERFPILYNKLFIQMPEYFNFQSNQVGGIPPIEDKKTTSTKSINFKTYTDQGMKGRDVEYRKFEMPFVNRNMVFTNVPSFVPEPYGIFEESGKAIISHQLISIAMPNDPIDIIASTYEKLNEDLLKDTDFGGVIKKGEFINDLMDWKSIKDTLKRAEAIYEHFVKNVSYDGYNGYLTSKGGQKLFKEGKGDAGDINLNYIAALKEAGVETYPVILRTYGEGILHPVYPNFSHINYVVAVSVIGNKDYFSDASSGLPFGALPTRALNGDGWLVVKESGGWVSLTKNTIGKQISQTKISIDGKQIRFSTKMNRSQKFAHEDFKVLSGDKKQDFLDNLAKSDKMQKDSSIVVDANINMVKYKLDHSQEIQDDAIIYVTPFSNAPFSQRNPFKSETRIGPINFVYPQEYKLVTNIDIPAGYTHELPQNLNISMEENEISFKYNVSFTAATNSLSVTTELKINQASIVPQNYTALKTIVDNIVEKLNEPIVLKKA